MNKYHTNYHDSYIESDDKGQISIIIVFPISNRKIKMQEINKSWNFIYDKKDSDSQNYHSIEDVLFSYLDEIFTEISLINNNLENEENQIDGAVSKAELKFLLSIKQEVDTLLNKLESIDKILNFIYKEKNMISAQVVLNMALRIDKAQFQVKTIESKVNALIDVSDLIYSQKQNNYIKRLSVLAILFSIPTFITSFYGMNIALPFQSHPALPLILLFANIFLSILTIIVLRKMEND